MNARIKNIVFPLLISFSVLVSVGYLSCKKDACSSVTCANGGVCSSGVCVCAAGYYGKNCDSLDREKFTGTWSVAETGSQSAANAYTITISDGATPTTVLIGNFYNFFTSPVSGYVTGDSLFIPTQRYQGKLIVGTGYIVPNAAYGADPDISMQYEVIDSATQSVNNFGCNGEGNPSQWNKD